MRALDRVTSEGGNAFVDGSVMGNAGSPGPGLPIVTLAAFALAVGLLVLFARVLRRSSTSAGPSKPVASDPITWARALVDLSIGVGGIAATLAVLSVATGSLPTGRDSLTISAERVEMRVEAGSFLTGTSFTARQASDLQFIRAREAYGDGAGHFDGTVFVIRADDPPLSVWALTIGTLAIWAFAIAAFMLALRSLLLRSELGAPFHLRNVAALRWMALALAAGPFLYELGMWRLANRIVDLGGGAEAIPFDMPWSSLAGAFLLLTLAEVWRYGGSLQIDVEATV